MARAHMPKLIEASSRSKPDPRRRPEPPEPEHELHPSPRTIRARFRRAAHRKHRKGGRK